MSIPIDTTITREQREKYNREHQVSNLVFQYTGERPERVSVCKQTYALEIVIRCKPMAKDKEHQLVCTLKAECGGPLRVDVNFDFQQQSAGASDCRHLRDAIIFAALWVIGYQPDICDVVNTSPQRFRATVGHRDLTTADTQGRLMNEVAKRIPAHVAIDFVFARTSQSARQDAEVKAMSFIEDERAAEVAFGRGSELAMAMKHARVYSASEVEAAKADAVRNCGKLDVDELARAMFNTRMRDKAEHIAEPQHALGKPDAPMLKREGKDTLVIRPRIGVHHDHAQRVNQVLAKMWDRELAMRTECEKMAKAVFEEAKQV